MHGIMHKCWRSQSHLSAVWSWFLGYDVLERSATAGLHQETKAPITKLKSLLSRRKAGSTVQAKPYHSYSPAACIVHFYGTKPSESLSFVENNTCPLLDLCAKMGLTMLFVIMRLNRHISVLRQAAKILSKENAHHV